MSLARFKEMLREQFLLVLLDQKRAVAALPKLLGADAAERGMALDVLHKVLAARGDLSEEGKRRLAEIEATIRGAAGEIQGRRRTRMPRPADIRTGGPANMHV